MGMEMNGIGVKANWNNPPENFPHHKTVENIYLNRLLEQVGGDVPALKDLWNEARRRQEKDGTFQKMHAIAVIQALPEDQQNDWETAAISLEFSPSARR